MAKPADLEALEDIELAVHSLSNAIGKPKLSGEQGQKWWQYDDHSIDAVILCKAVRVSSGLNAARILLEAGFVAEVGVILRTLDDFVDEITFLTEALESGEQPAAHKQFLEAFFAQRILSREEWLAQEKAEAYLPKKKIRASQARQLGKDDPDHVRKITSVIDRTLDAFVHGHYPTAMELYDGRVHRFSLRGMPGTPNLSVMREHLLHYIYRALAVLGVYAAVRGLGEVAEGTKKAASKFMSGTGYSLVKD
jgi:hypothetical protein